MRKTGSFATPNRLGESSVPKNRVLVQDGVGKRNASTAASNNEGDVPVLYVPLVCESTRPCDLSGA